MSAVRLALCSWLAAVAPQGPTTQPAPTQPDLVFVLAGQSNMEGYAYLENRDGPSTHVMQYGPVQLIWKPAAEPVFGPKEIPDLPGLGSGPPWSLRPEPKVRGFGPGIAFGEELALRTGKIIGLVPVAVSGTTMQQWDPALKSDPNSLYAKMLERVRQSGGRVAGVLWYQGESDALGDGPTVSAYPERLDAFIKAVRLDFGGSNLPFVFAQISRFVNAPPVNGPSWNFVQEAQRTIGVRTAKAAVLSTVDLPLDDVIHLATEGERRLGKRFGKATAKLLQIPGAPELGPTLEKAEFEGTFRDRIRLAYSRVNGGLKPTGRIAGFTIQTGGGAPSTPVYDASVDPRRTNSVVVRLADAAPIGVTLSYGRGLDPTCDLVDDEDLAAPAFGPLALP